MNVKELAKKLNLKLKKDSVEKEIEKNEKALEYLNLNTRQKEVIALITLSGRSIESITLRGQRSKYQVGCNLGKAAVRYFYEED